MPTERVWGRHSLASFGAHACAPMSELRMAPPHPRPQHTQGYSHSMVPGGFDVTSSTTRFTPGTSFVIRLETRARTSYGTRVQSAVIASSDDTGRRTIGCP